MPRPSNTASTDAAALARPIVAVAVQVPVSTATPLTAATTSMDWVSGSQAELVTTTSMPTAGGNAGWSEPLPADGGTEVDGGGGGGAETDDEGIGIEVVSPGGAGIDEPLEVLDVLAPDALLLWL